MSTDKFHLFVIDKMFRADQREAQRRRREPAIFETSLKSRQQPFHRSPFVRALRAAPGLFCDDVLKVFLVLVDNLV